MASSFPGTLDSFATSRVDATPMATNHVADHNNYADAINKIEAELGIDPAGASATVKDRLDAGIFGALAVDTTSLVVDAANNRVGIGQATPLHRVHITHNDETQRALYVDSDDDLAAEVGVSGNVNAAVRNGAMVSMRRIMNSDQVSEAILTVQGKVDSLSPTMVADKHGVASLIHCSVAAPLPFGPNVIAFLGQGYISNNVTNGRVVTALMEARHNTASDDGLLIPLEVGIVNMGAVQTSVDHAAAKVGIWIGGRTSTLSTAKSTAGISFSNDPAHFHYGFYMRGITQSFITMAGSSNPVNAIDMSAITPSGDAILMGTGAVLRWGASGTRLSVGSGTPEAAVTAPAGSLFARTEGGLYQKQTGTGTTGWGPPLRAIRQGHVVSTSFPFWNVGTPAVMTANQAYGVRVEMPASGTLQDVLVFVGTASGNVDVGVYSISGTDRTRLWSSGSTAVAGTNAWQNLGDPGIAVTAGQWLDFVVAVDNGTVTLGRLTTAAASCGTLPSGVDDLAPSHVWGKGTSFVLPSSITTVGASNIVPVIVARVTP